MRHVTSMKESCNLHLIMSHITHMSETYDIVPRSSPCPSEIKDREREKLRARTHTRALHPSLARARARALSLSLFCTLSLSLLCSPSLHLSPPVSLSPSMNPALNPHPHQGAAFDALSEEEQEVWMRRVSINRYFSRAISFSLFLFSSLSHYLSLSHTHTCITSLSRAV